MPQSRNFRACLTVLHSLTIMLMVEHYGAFVAGKDPLVLWTEKSYIWSKIRGIEGPPQTWIHTRYTPFVHTETEESFRYAIGYSQQTNELVWSDKLDKKIYRQPMKDAVKDRNLNNIAPVLTGTSASINGLAVDWLAGNVHFTDGEKKIIAVAPLTATQMNLYIILHKDNVSSPTGIAVDPYKGKLFWADAESGRLETSSTDGQSREVIVSSLRYVSEPVGLTIDYSTETIYFLDRSKRHIVSCNYEGDNVEILHTAEDQADLTISYFSISFWTEYLYVSTEAGLHLQVYNRTSGSLLEVLDLDANIYDIIVPKEHDSPNHACDELDCQQICLNVGEYKGVCACAEDYYLEMDGRTCSESNAWFIYSIGQKIVSTKVRAKASQPELLFAEEQLVKDNQDLVKALGFSYKERALFFSDTVQGVIYRGNPEEGVSSTWKELTVNTGEVEGIAVDWLSKNVYWADKELGHIMVSHLDGRYHKILLENIGEPLGLAVDPTRGYLYWVSQGTGTSGAYISRASLDGTGKHVFVDTDLREPQGLVFDTRKNRLYWTDKGHWEIHYIDVISKQRQRVVSRLSSRLYDVAVFLNYTTWTDGGDGLQFMMEGMENKLDSANLKLAAGENFESSYDVITYGTYLQPETSGGCFDDNGGCQQLCFPTLNGFTCACAIGYTKDADGVSCKSETIGAEFVLYTDPCHKQIYQSNMNVESAQTHSVPVPRMQYPISADYDSGNGRLYWVDVETPAIKSADMTGENFESLLSFSAGNSQPQRLATDPSSNNLFYSTRDAIYKVDKENGKATSFVTGIHMTTSLTIDFTNGLLYWAEGGSPTLIRQSSTESAVGLPSTVLEVEHPVSSISVIGEEDMIYYSVREEGSIKAFNLSTQSATVLFSDKTYHIISISASLKYLYFTTWNKRSVYRISRADGREFTVIARPIFARLTDVRAYDSRRPPARPVETEEGLPIPIIASVGAGVLFLLLLLMLVGVLVARRRRSKLKPKATATVGNPQDVQEDAELDHNYLEIIEGEVTTPGGKATLKADCASNGDPTVNDAASHDREVVYQNTTDSGHVSSPPTPPENHLEGELTLSGDVITNGDETAGPETETTYQHTADDGQDFPPLPPQEGEATPIGDVTTNEDSTAIGAANPDGEAVYRDTTDDVNVLPPLPPPESPPEDRATLPQDQEDVTMEDDGDAQMTAIGPERGKDTLDSKHRNKGRPMAPASHSR